MIPMVKIAVCRGFDDILHKESLEQMHAHWPAEVLYTCAAAVPYNDGKHFSIAVGRQELAY